MKKECALALGCEHFIESELCDAGQCTLRPSKWSEELEGESNRQKKWYCPCSATFQDSAL